MASDRHKRLSGVVIEGLAMGTDLWKPPQLKIGRAKHHIADLDERCAKFLADEPFETVIRQDPDLGEFTLRRKTNHPIPDEFALIIGDAVHNLRSALDLTVFGLIGALAERPEAVQFPFAKNSERFKSVFAQRQIGAAGENVRKVIQQLKPYGGRNHLLQPDGNFLLHGLHELDILDKHKLVVPVASIFTIVADDMRKFGPAFDCFEGTGSVQFVNVDTDVLVSIQLDIDERERHALPSFEERTKFQPPFSICFGVDQPFTGLLVVPTLVSLVQEVERAVGLIRAAAEADSKAETVAVG